MYAARNANKSVSNLREEVDDVVAKVSLIYDFLESGPALPPGAIQMIVKRLRIAKDAAENMKSLTEKRLVKVRDGNISRSAFLVAEIKGTLPEARRQLLASLKALEGALIVCQL